MNLSSDEVSFLKQAAQFFENPGLFVKGMSLVAKPIELSEKALPGFARKVIAKASKRAIDKAFKFSLTTLSRQAVEGGGSFKQAHANTQKVDAFHTGLSSAVGGVGGVFGLLSLPIELPISTIIMLRSIAEISRQYGNDLTKEEGRLECLYVFGLGSGSSHDDSVESSYYSSRIAFSRLMKNSGALLAKIAARFEIRVANKMLAQLAPLAGAMGGAGINMLFAKYYNECARYHFGIRRLEREYGQENVQAMFEKFRSQARDVTADAS